MFITSSLREEFKVIEMIQLLHIKKFQNDFPKNILINALVRYTCIMPDAKVTDITIHNGEHFCDFFEAYASEYLEEIGFMNERQLPEGG